MRGARLHRGRVLAVRTDFDFHAPLRGGRHGVEFRGLDAPLDDDVAGRVGVNRRRPCHQRRLSIHQRRRFLDLDGDEIGKVLGGLPAVRHHRSNRFADEAHDVGCQDRLGDRRIVELVQHRGDGAQCGDLGGRHQHDAVWRRDAHDTAGRDRTAHEPNPLRGRQIAGEATLPGYQRRILDPTYGAAHPAGWGLEGTKHGSPLPVGDTDCKGAKVVAVCKVPIVHSDSGFHRQAENKYRESDRRHRRA